MSPSGSEPLVVRARLRDPAPKRAPSLTGRVLASPALPFVGVAVLALATLPLPSGGEVELADQAAAAVLALSIFAAGLALTWRGLPLRLARVVPAFGYFAVVILLRHVEGGAPSGFGPLVLLPVTWLALYGTRTELAASIALVPVVFIAPILVVGAPEYPDSEWGRALLWGLVAPLVGFTVRRLVDEVRTTARIDALTGLPNRLAWDETLARELARSTRGGYPICVAILDLDRFKTYNDRHGHQAGDRMLRRASEAWSGNLRQSDFLARWGGEEFGLIIGAEPPEAVEAVDRVLRATPDQETCSAGVAAWGHGEDPDSLLGRADHALYAAKLAGRDRSVLAQPAGAEDEPSKSMPVDPEIRAT